MARWNEVVIRCPGTESLTQKSVYSYNFPPDLHCMHGSEGVLSCDKVE